MLRISRQKIVVGTKIKMMMMMMMMMMMAQDYSDYIGNYIDLGNYKDDEDTKTDDSGKYTHQDDDDCGVWS